MDTIQSEYESLDNEDNIFDTSIIGLDDFTGSNIYKGDIVYEIDEKFVIGPMLNIQSINEPTREIYKQLEDIYGYPVSFSRKIANKSHLHDIYMNSKHIPMIMTLLENKLAFSSALDTIRVILSYLDKKERTTEEIDIINIYIRVGLLYPDRI